MRRSSTESYLSPCSTKFPRRSRCHFPGCLPSSPLSRASSRGPVPTRRGSREANAATEAPLAPCAFVVIVKRAVAVAGASCVAAKRERRRRAGRRRPEERPLSALCACDIYCRSSCFYSRRLRTERVEVSIVFVGDCCIWGGRRTSVAKFLFFRVDRLRQPRARDPRGDIFFRERFLLKISVAIINEAESGVSLVPHRV